MQRNVGREPETWRLPWIAAVFLAHLCRFSVYGPVGTVQQLNNVRARVHLRPLPYIRGGAATEGHKVVRVVELSANYQHLSPLFNGHLVLLSLTPIGGRTT